MGARRLPRVREADDLGGRPGAGGGGRIGPGQRVLDVGAGTGNAAIRAAQAGASVVACDVTPENFAAGRREAQAQGLALEWVAADAQALPFEAHEFDVVMSCLGAIFAPDHNAVADEMVRVCRPGGTIAMANFPHEGLAASFFEVLGRHAPAPPGTASPLEWGDEDHVRDLFAERVESLELTPRVYVERAANPAEYVRLHRESFGPVIAIFSTSPSAATEPAPASRPNIRTSTAS